MSAGLTVTANYTYGKSIDDASDASPDKNVLTTGSTAGNVTFGAPRSTDRSISAFDIRHSFNTTFVYDLPFGRDHALLRDARPLWQWLAGDWTLAGLSPDGRVSVPAEVFRHQPAQRRSDAHGAAGPRARRAARQSAVEPRLSVEQCLRAVHQPGGIHAADQRRAGRCAADAQYPRADAALLRSRHPEELPRRPWRRSAYSCASIC